jgi:Uma2 family endonuclease
MVQAGQRLTLEDFLALPEEKPALEYIDGEVVQKVSPKLRHGLAQTTFVTLVNAAGLPNRLALAVVETRCTFGGRSYVPDVVVFTWKRIPVDEDGEVLDDVAFAPDVTVEVVSPSHSIAEQVRRCRWYGANGVRVALLLDPRVRAGRYVRAFRPGLRRAPCGAGAARAGAGGSARRRAAARRS